MADDRFEKLCDLVEEGLAAGDARYCKAAISVIRMLRDRVEAERWLCELFSAELDKERGRLRDLAARKTASPVNIPISSVELIARTGGAENQFERGPFPPEMRMKADGR